MCWCNPKIRTPCCGKPDCHPNLSNRPDIKAEIIEKLISAFDMALTLDRLDLDYEFEDNKFKIKIEIEEK